jgi:hypothetical protein
MTTRACQAKTAAGDKCQAPATATGFCFVHDPTRGAERAAARKAGGRARHTPHSDAALPPAQIRDLPGVLLLLDYTAGELMVMPNSLQRARALIALAAAYVSALSVGELEERLAALEAAEKARAA